MTGSASAQGDFADVLGVPVDELSPTRLSPPGGRDSGYASLAVNRHLADVTLLLDDPARVGKLVVGGDLNITTQWTRRERAYRDIEKAQLAQLEAFGLTELVADCAPGPLEGCGCADGQACRHQLTHWRATAAGLGRTTTCSSDHAPLILDLDLSEPGEE